MRLLGLTAKLIQYKPNYRGRKEQAINTIEKTTMSRKDFSRVFYSRKAFKRRFCKVTQLTKNASKHAA